jgi:hypothetical protein
MSQKKGPFQHGAARQKEYEREARLQYDPATVNESIKRWNNYTRAEQDYIMDEGNRIYMDIVAAIEADKAPNDVEVQTLLERWHEHLRYFYEPTLEILGGLGQLYNSSPDFIANFQKLHPDLPAYLEEAIAKYVDDLETAEIERMLAEDEDIKQRKNHLSE